MSNKIYPIGIQNFEKIRNDGYFYIDKTALMYQMVKTGSYYFLSRPRRFGKSLLISTLEAYFQGKKANVEEYIDNGYHMYARLLGFRKDNAKLLTAMSKESSLPVLTKMSEIDDLPELGQKMLRHDMLASNLYTSVVTDKFKTAFQNEYKQGVLKV